MSIMTFNAGCFQTARATAPPDSMDRSFRVAGSSVDLAIFVLDDNGTPTNVLARHAHGIFDIVIPAPDPAQPNKHDDAICDTLCQQELWKVVLQNYSKVCAMGNYLAQNPGHRAGILASGVAQGRLGYSQFGAEVVYKNVGAAHKGHGEFDLEWFTEKREAAEDALNRMQTQATLYLDEFVRLRDQGQLVVVPPVVQGLDWKEQLDRVGITLSVAGFGYREKVIC